MDRKKILCFVVLIILLLGLFFISINWGSIHVTYKELMKGLFVAYNEDVATIYDLRFPRIIIAMLAGSALAVSGVLFQAVLKNPLADPSIIGISAGANFVSVCMISFFPTFFFLTPIFAFLGGILACIIVYFLSWKDGFSSLRIILVGIAVNAVFMGLYQSFQSMSGPNYAIASEIVNANISMKTWDDVRLLSIYAILGLALSLCVAKNCNLLGLEDKTIRSLGINVNYLRIIVSFIAVLLASITTAVAGMVSFIGLIVPHMSRLLVGNEHKCLIPFSALLGAFIMLLADTVGRLIAYPYEISAAIIMSIVGGPFFIVLLKRSDRSYGS